MARGLAAHRVADEVGLVAASEVWGGDAPRERPAWYVWLRGSPGAWQIELVAAERVGANAFSGKFVVRYYPSRDEPDFSSFSDEERSFATTGLDATGTPRIDLASRLPESSFTVGGLEWSVDLDTDESVVAMWSLDRLRVRSKLDRDRSSGPALLRDVPGWKLTTPMFSALAGMHAQIDRQTAARLVITSSPGFELVSSGEAVEPRDTSDTAHGEVLVGFAPADAPPSRSPLVDVLRDADASVVVDEFLPRYHSDRPIEHDPRFPIIVRHSWFGGEEHPATRIACSC